MKFCIRSKLGSWLCVAVATAMGAIGCKNRDHGGSLLGNVPAVPIPKEKEIPDIDSTHFEFYGNPENLSGGFKSGGLLAATSATVRSYYVDRQLKLNEVYTPGSGESFTFQECKSRSNVAGDCMVEFSYNDDKLIRSKFRKLGYRSSRLWVPDVSEDITKKLPLVIMLHGINYPENPAKGGDIHEDMHKFMGGVPEEAKQLYILAGDLIKSGIIEPLVIAAPSQNLNQKNVSGTLSDHLWVDFDLERFIDEVKRNLPSDVNIDEDNIVLMGHSGAGCNSKGGLRKTLNEYNSKTNPKYKLRYIVLSEVCFKGGYKKYKKFLRRYPYSKVLAVAGANAVNIHKIAYLNSQFGATSDIGPDAVACDSDIFVKCVTDKQRYYGYTINSISVDPSGTIKSVKVKHSTLTGIFFQKFLLRYFVKEKISSENGLFGGTDIGPLPSGT